MVADLIAALPDGEYDGVAALCAGLPARLMVHLLGLPADITERFQRWPNAFMLGADLSAEDRDASNRERVGYFVQTVAERAARLTAGGTPNDDLIDALLTAEADGQRLSTDEVWCF